MNYRIFMGNMRAKILIGTTITSVALMFAAISGVIPLGMNQASVSEVGGILGHVEILAIHPDGTQQYVQGDNVLLFEGKNTVATTLWTDGTTTGFNCIQLGTNADAADDADGGVKAAAATPVECGDDGTPNSVGETTAASAGVSSTFRITVVFDIVAGDDGATITEVALRDEASVDLSRFVLASGVGVNTGTVLTVNYDMTVT